jgi:hypothetical protein
MIGNISISNTRHAQRRSALKKQVDIRCRPSAGGITTDQEIKIGGRYGGEAWLGGTSLSFKNERNAKSGTEPIAGTADTTATAAAQAPH